MKTKALSLLLAFLLLFSSFSITITAAVSLVQTPSANTTDSFASAQETENEITEVISKREANVKHFKLKDDTYQAVVYTEAVHRKNADGNWVDIDNHLFSAHQNGKPVYATSDERAWFSTNPVFNERLMTLSENGYSVSWSFASLSLVNPTTPRISNHIAKEALTSDDTTAGQYATINKTSSVRYKDILHNTDVEYVLSSNSVKENIIIQGRSTAYDYAFYLYTENLSATLYDDGHIILSDITTQEPVYKIPAPYMYDADGNISHNVTYSLTEVKTGQYCLTVSADPTWINEPGRSFPITVDPSVEVATPIWDSYIDPENPVTNYGLSEKLLISSAGQMAFIETILPALPSSAQITSANLKIWYGYENTTVSDVTIGAYMLLHTWDETGVVWNIIDFEEGMSKTLQSSVTCSSTGATLSSPKSATFDITNAAIDWYSGTPKHGIVLKYLSGGNATVYVHASETGFTYRPRFTFNYVWTAIPDGIYALENCGNSGRWMDIQQSKSTSGYHVQQYAYNPSPIDVNDAAGMFKITNVEGSDRYIIRLMLNNSLSFGISGNEILTKTIPANDADVSIYDTFYIEGNSDGFIIRPYGSSEVITAKNTMASGLSGAPDSYLTTVSESAATNRAKWKLIALYNFIKDGVYALKNLGNVSRWMDIQQSQTSAGYHVQQYDYPSSPATIPDRAGLFKISQVGTTGRYIIRLMLNNCLTFGVSDGEILTKEIPADDEEVSATDTFRIVYSEGCYIIRPYTTDYCISAQDTLASGMSGAPDSYLKPRTIEDAGNRARWNLIPFQKTDCGVILESSSGIYAGQSVSLTPIFWSTAINYNNLEISMPGEYSSIATFEWDNADQKAYLTLHQDGDIVLNAKIYNSEKTSYLSATTTVTVNLLVEEGIYFIANKGVNDNDNLCDDYYVQIDNNADSYYNEGEILEVYNALDYSDHKKWEFSHIEDGYYKITSVISGLAISVPSSTDSGCTLIQQEYQGLSTQKWKVSISQSGNYILTPLSAPNWCMAARGAIADIIQPVTDGRNVVQKAYDNDSDYRDEWALAHIVKTSPTEYEAQEETNWCWATSARMFAMNYEPSITATQSDAVLAVKGSIVNQGASPAETIKAVDYYLSTVTNKNYNVRGTGIFSEEILLRFLNDGHVIIALQEVYDSKEGAFCDSGHCSVICGYVKSGSNYLFIVNDPDLIVPTPLLYSYQRLCDGNNPASGETKEENYKVWTHSIVVSTPYKNS